MLVKRKTLKAAKAALETGMEAWEMLIPCVKNNAVQDYELVLTRAPLEMRAAISALDEMLSPATKPTHPEVHVIQTAAVTYEWDVETWDGEDGDILDHFHADTLEELLMNYGVLGPNDHVVLVRDTDDGDRDWCYFDEPHQAQKLARKNGRPEFDGGTKVPEKLLAEARKFLDEKGIPRLPYPTHPGLDGEGAA